MILNDSVWFVDDVCMSVYDCRCCVYDACMIGYYVYGLTCACMIVVELCILSFKYNTRLYIRHNHTI